MKRYDSTYSFAETVLKNLGWTSEEITRTLTDDLVIKLTDSVREEKLEILRNLNEQRLDALATAEDVPMHMKVVDFRCTNPDCGLEMPDEMVDVPEGLPLTRLTMSCSACGADAAYFIPHGTRIAMQGEENAPREQITAARLAAVRGAVAEPFHGTTRSELKQWERANDVTAMPVDEAKRGNSTINTKTKITQRPEFEAHLAAEVNKALAIAEAGGDRLAEAKAAIGKPNDYDVDRFKEQASVGVVDGAVPMKEGSVPVADVAQELTPVKRANQSRNQIAPERAE